MFSRRHLPLVLALLSTALLLVDACFPPPAARADPIDAPRPATRAVPLVADELERAVRSLLRPAPHTVPGTTTGSAAGLRDESPR